MQVNSGKIGVWTFQSKANGSRPCLKWIESYFHPNGQKCPHYGADFEQGRWIRKTKRSDLDVHRCQNCRGIYNVYRDTVIEGRYFTLEQMVLFIRGVFQGQASAQLARELSISRTTATEVVHQLQAQPETCLDDLEVETDEMFQNVGEKGGIPTRLIHPVLGPTNGADGVPMPMIARRCEPSSGARRVKFGFG